MLTNKRTDGSTLKAVQDVLAYPKKAVDKQAHEYPWSLWSCKLV